MLPRLTEERLEGVRQTVVFLEFKLHHHGQAIEMECHLAGKLSRYETVMSHSISKECQRVRGVCGYIYRGVQPPRAVELVIFQRTQKIPQGRGLGRMRFHGALTSAGATVPRQKINHCLP